MRLLTEMGSASTNEAIASSSLRIRDFWSDKEGIMGVLRVCDWLVFFVRSAVRQVEEAPKYQAKCKNNERRGGAKR